MEGTAKPRNATLKTIGLLAVGCVVGCVGGYGMGKSDNSAPTASAAASSIPATAAPAAVAAAPAPPEHRWITHDGGEYGYSAALTDDEKKDGRAAETVHMYRYLGEKNGVYTVALDENGIEGRVSCESPCTVVKMFSGGQVERATFNPDSIMGAALTDAMNGQMEVWKPPASQSADAE